jgi:hypothetical protein
MMQSGDLLQSKEEAVSPMQYKTYHTIDATRNILASLVESLNNDKAFQEQLETMNTSSDPGEKKKSSLIKHTINNIRMFNTSDKPLVLASDIGTLLGTSQHINQIVKRYDSEEKVIGYIKENNKLKKVMFLTKYGIHKCIHTSHSPFATMISRFMTDLIEETLTKDFKKVKRFAEKFTTKNPDLVDAGMIDLQDKLSEYQQKLLEEQRRALLLEKQCSELKDENTELDLAKSYNIMHINQLKKEKSNQMKRVETITNEFIDASNNTTEAIELRKLKEMLMKPMYIYVLTPKYLKKLLQGTSDSLSTKQSSKKQVRKGSEIDFSSDDEDDKSNKSNKTNKKDLAHQKQLALNLVDMDTYEKNFKTIYKSEFMGKTSEQSITIDKEELLYFYTKLSRNVSKKDKLIHVDTQYVVNTTHYVNVMKSLTQDCITLDLSTKSQKMVLYQASLREICEVVREEFIKLV